MWELPPFRFPNVREEKFESDFDVSSFCGNSSQTLRSISKKEFFGKNNFFRKELKRETDFVD
ncbi:hypothetical protein LEP1GSC036_3219 [Leptospira weilii str. 2006001853]|uniref:Uncharacterized protein n=1 Tax=Leptospira weilii str. 2006001853 TaxID=1001589 RepID=A0A828Z417_9LEPT|nr:hypothetical protein LEP1GSC036_3219 [Leptospira weilii str. 2006001853]